MAVDIPGDPAIPRFGFGTSGHDDPDQCVESVRTALEVGYRHLDTAEMYGNERSVGAAIGQAPVPREDVFLATKVLHPRDAETAEPSRVVSAGRAGLERLGVDRVDALYLHWPDDYDLEDAFEGFDRLHREGAFDRLGVCNLTPALLDEARDLATQPIDLLQVECHPLLPQAELRDYCARHDIAFVAYAPVLHGRAAEVPALVEVAERHGATPTQVSLAWLRAKGAIPIPKATSAAHLRENWAARDLELTADDVATIDAIDRERRLIDPDHAAW